MAAENNIKNKKRRISSGRIAVYIALFAGGAIMLVPLFVLLVTSLKSYPELIEYPSAIMPKHITFEAFSVVFKENPFFLYLRNTMLITAASVLGCAFTSAFVAYGFTRFKVKGSGLIFAVFIAGIMIPGQVLTIPMFELYDKINWVNTFLPFIIPPFFGGGIVNIFLQRQFMKGIPASIMEAAEIDGAHELKIFFNITLRMVVPVMITVTIFTFIGSWNDLFGPLIYLDDPSLWTLAKGNYMIYQAELGKQGSAGTSVLPWNILSAANLLVTIPIILLFFIAQRYFTEGIQLSGLKE